MAYAALQTDPKLNKVQVAGLLYPTLLLQNEDIFIITGHNKHLHRINRSDTPNCLNCTDIEETVAYYIGQCRAYSRIRGDTLKAKQVLLDSLSRRQVSLLLLSAHRLQQRI